MGRKTQVAGLAAIAAGLLALSPALASANTSVTPGAISYPGSTAVGSTSAPQGVTVLVSCTTVVNIPFPVCVTPGIFQPNPATTGDFAVATNGCGTGVIPGSDPFVPIPCVITVTFKPKAPGLRTGTLTVGSDQSPGGTQPGSVSLTGAGVAGPSGAVAGTTTGKKCKKAKKGSAQIAKKKCKKK